MEWLNLPFVEMAFAFGSFIGALLGAGAMTGIESWTGYNRGYQAGYKRAMKERDAK